MIKFLPKFRGVVAKTKKYVKFAFAACDLDGNGICDIREFHTMFKYIEPKTFTIEEINSIFQKEADLFDEGEHCMSFDKFAMLCADYNIFSSAKQDLYLDITSEIDLNKLWNKIAYDWLEQHDKIKERLIFCRRYLKEEEYERWVEALKVLNDRMLC